MISTVTQRCVLTILLLALTCVACRNTQSATPDEGSARGEAEPIRYIEPQTAVASRKLWRIPDSDMTFTAWTTSDDGALSLRLLTPKAPISADEPLFVLGELRNNTDDPLNVFRLFSSTSGAWTMTVTRPDGEVDHTGPTDMRPHVLDSRRTIPPGYAHRDWTALGVDRLPGSDSPGVYSLVFLYSTAARSDPGLWAGEIQSPPITIEKR